MNEKLDRLELGMGRMFREMFPRPKLQFVISCLFTAASFLTHYGAPYEMTRRHILPLF